MIKIYNKYFFQNSRPHSSIKYATDTKTGKSLLRPINGTAKSISKPIPIIKIMTKNNYSDATINFTTDPLFKLNVESCNSIVTTNNEKLQKRNTTNVDPAFKINKKTVKKEELSTSKIILKQEIGCVSKFCKDMSNKKQHKFENYINKTNNVNTKLQKSKTKIISSRMLSPSKSTGNVKCSSDLTKSSHGKIRSKTKIKPNRTTETKSEILNFDKELSGNPFIVENNNIDLADLIEASLKNIRSPRSIFDYDFSYLQQLNTVKSTPEAEKEISRFNQSKDRKPLRHNIILDYFSDKITRGDRILEKLSERSEPFSSRSNDPLLKNQKHSSNNGDGSMSMSEKHTKARAELRKSLSLKQGNNLVLSNVDRKDPDLYANLQDKSLNQRKIGNITEKIHLSRGPSKTYGLLKANVSNGLGNKQTDFIEKNFQTFLND